MTNLPTARLRLFASDEFTRPDGWPDDVGIAVLQTGREPEIFPVHQTETHAGIVKRIESLTSRDLGAAAVFPPLEGHPHCDLPFTAVAKLRAEIESFLSRTPAAVEEAADFSVNFDFAAEEGLDLTVLVRRTSARTDDPPEAKVASDLPGYAPFDPGLPPYRASIPATLWLTPSGELVIVTDPDAEPFKLDPSDVLVREDGLGLALRRSCPGLAGGLPGYILLPSGCLGFDPPSYGLQVLIMPRERHYLVTPVLDWPEPSLPSEPAWPTVSAHPVAMQPQYAPAIRSRSIAALACITASLFAALLLNLEPNKVTETADAPLPRLRAELFD